MVYFPHKRVWGLIGPQRAGKNTVARFLKESRNFDSFAFADQIKEEFGISVDDFEATKHTNNIESLRNSLWDFSAEQKKKRGSRCFIDPILKKAHKSEKSVVITDIRTEEEFNAFFEYFGDRNNTRVYTVGETYGNWWDKFPSNSVEYTYILKGSQISKDFYYKQLAKDKIRLISNDKDGMLKFYKRLEEFFIKEDIMDLVGPSEPEPDKHKNDKQRSIILSYLDQFKMVEK